MSKAFKVGCLAGILMITAFAFAENGGQISTAATVAVSQPETVAPLPQMPAAKQPAAVREVPLGISYGFDERFRADTANNQADETNAVNDENRSIHPRTRIFANFNLGRDVDLYLREGSEPYKKLYATCNSTSATCASGAPSQAGKSISAPFAFQQIWVDNAFLNFKRLPGLPSMSLKVGRFDFNEGEGFFFMGGALAPGPRVGFNDGILLTYHKGPHTLELLGTENERIDNFFPVINRDYKSTQNVSVAPSPDLMNDMGDLGAIILYYKNRQLKNTDIDAYYSWNKQDNMLPPGYNDLTKYTAAGYAQYQFQPDRNWSAFGGRVVQRFPHTIIAHANYTAEVGRQDAMTQQHNNPLMPGVGSDGINGYPQVNIRAFGADAFVNKYFQFKTKPFVGVTWAYFSGSDPKSPKTDGNYIMAFGQWSLTNQPFPFMEQGYPVASPMADGDPNFSVREIGITPAYMTNWETINFRTGFTPYQGKVRWVKAWAEYHHTDAPHPMMGNAAHYNPNPVAGATYAQLLTPVIDTAPAAAGYPDFSPAYLCSPNSGSPVCTYTGGRLHRYDTYEFEVMSQLSKNLNAFIYWDHYVLGNFYNAQWTLKPYTGAPAAVVANRSDAYMFRFHIAYRFDLFQPYKKATN